MIPRPSWLPWVVGLLVGGGLGALAYRELRPLPPVPPVDVVQIQAELAKQRELIENTRTSLIEEIRKEHIINVQKVYVQAGKRIEELGQDPKTLARDLARLVHRTRVERFYGQAQTSTTVR